VTLPMARVGDLADQIRGVTTTSPKRSQMHDRIPACPAAGNIADDGLVFKHLVFVPAERSEPSRGSSDDVVIAASSGSLSVVGKQPGSRRLRRWIRRLLQSPASQTGY